ncbi:DUF3373 domain-containing protein [Rhodoferax sp.]|jgi:hypothetical protein|uniref:DUF3373 domain-containing protein n=1 Tax=Rhodoferax sp. TaxID=50421 RepID=UPI0027275704|nr:DUF3373 domain-containing protein [Rhodoferax sp.]MDO9144795.1 DUF3373 domain-containing protein [Rhodoferax sp.]MDP1530661.1 DUF3373 domain-containing protein [Rhodoferax sp.]MDP1944724.1 DUF3373 domain-containing protein [Rhodoferax sp.]MDP2443585.1 DUF3373 domain-containing protein [Rhodoferax sp.]MDP3189940.1 DUF3373 domain-containing protein [Rhodoferax sp.]
MDKRFQKKLLVALITGMLMPLAASAADADLMSKIEAMSRELEALKAQVKANEVKSAQTAEQVKAVAAKTESTEVAELKSQVTRLEGKSLSKWLTIGGDYRFRYDYLEGQSKTFTDVSATFANAQTSLQTAMLTDTTGTAAANLAGLAQFSSAMMGVQTYDQAVAFQPMVDGMMPALGAYAVTVPAYKPKNSSLYSNRFNLNLNAKATQDVSVTANLAMYKVFGSQTDSAVTNAGSAPFFADRVGVFDGTLSHVPSSSNLNVDRVYATWSNIADQEMWLSVGRRPSTGGAPSNLRNNTAVRPGNGGTPSLLVDYAFDGVTLGYAPEIDALPGAYAKFCYGRGFESGFTDFTGNSLEDTDMVGISVVPIDTDPLRVWLQWNRGMNIFDAPTMSNTYFGNTAPKTNLGDIDWFGVGFMSTHKNVGPGTLQVFGDVGMSITRPNNNVSAQFGFQGLMTGAFFNPEAPSTKKGTAVALGVRYDLPSRSKFGFEWNHGSKNWITFAPAADDMWTAKMGTRGDVYEAYYIQELDRQPISSFFSKAFFRVGVQYYKFDYTGSNNWVGAPVAIGDVNGNLMTTTPLEDATNLYATFEVKF